MSEERLIRQCAPTLAGIKTGSLFPCPYETLEAMAKGYAAERNWSLSRLKLPANPLRRKSAQKEKKE